MTKDQLAKKCQQYEQFSALDPDNTLLLIQLGDLYHALGEFAKASQAFSRVAELEPENKVALGRLANVLLSDGRSVEAENIFTELLKYSPEDTALQHNYAISLFAQHKHQLAKDIFIAQQNDGMVGRSARFYLASILQIDDRVQDALEIVNALLQEKEEVHLLGYQSTLLYLLERVEEAISIAEKAVLMDENNVDACSILGNFYAEQLEFDIAERMFNRILQYSPGDVRGWHGIGIMKLFQQNITEAINYFERTTTMLPGSIAMWNTLAWAYFNNRQYTEAETAFSRVISIDQTNPEGWGGIACAQAMQSRLDDADQSFRKAIRLDKQSFSALFAKSIIVALKGNKNKGEVILTKVLEQPIRPGGEKAIDTINRFMKLNQSKDVTVITQNTKKNIH